MTKRRDKGSGSVYQTEPGTWVGSIDVGFTPTGSRRRKTVKGHTKAAVTKRLGEIRRQLEDTGGASGNTTVKAYLDGWAAGLRVKPTTAATYRRAVRLYLIPALGRHRLAALQPAHIRAMVADIEARDLSTATVHGAHRVLRAALSQAVSDGLIPRNVAKLVHVPTPRPSDDVLTETQAKALLRSLSDDDPLTARWAVALLLGLRQGEALGMEWDRILAGDEGTVLDLSWQLQRIPYRHGCAKVGSNSGQVWSCGFKRPGSCPQRALAVPPGFDHRIVHGALCLTRPKSAAGWRMIPLPPLVLAGLLAHRERHGDQGLVFTRPDGRPIDPSDDNAAWHRALKAAGLPSVKLHAARHTTATLLLELHVDPKVVQQIMGHSTILQTRQYQTVSVGTSRIALESVSGLFED